MDRIGNPTVNVQFRWITFGFGVCALGLALLCLDSTLELAFILSFEPLLRKILVHPVWTIGVSSAITGLTFLGSYALWRRLPTTSWQRYSTLLLIMNIIHVVFWIMDHHAQLGLPNQNFEHGWLRLQVSQIFNWLEFLAWLWLMRSLFDFLRQQFPELSKTSVFGVYTGYAWFGMMVSIGIAIGLTDWQRGWPLQRVGWLGRMDSLMLATVTTMLSLAASFQLALYCLRAMLISRYFQPRFRQIADDAKMNWYQDDWQQDPWGQKYHD
jgi:hypothetical protein